VGVGLLLLLASLALLLLLLLLLLALVLLLAWLSLLLVLLSWRLLLDTHMYQGVIIKYVAFTGSEFMWHTVVIIRRMHRKTAPCTHISGCTSQKEVDYMQSK